jgi:hypothetical protein
MLQSSEETLEEQTVCHLLEPFFGVPKNVVDQDSRHAFVREYDVLNALLQRLNWSERLYHVQTTSSRRKLPGSDRWAVEGYL